MKYSLLLALLMAFSGVYGQTDTTQSKEVLIPTYPGVQAKKNKRMYEVPDAKAFGATITAADLKVLVDALASREFEGRETGEAGQRKAAEFIAKQFKDAGIAGKVDGASYYQKILLGNDSWKDIGLTVGPQEFKNRVDFYVYPAFNTSIPKLDIKELVFVGYGIDDPKYSDYGKTDVKGKAVILYDGEPLDDKGKSVLTGSELRSSWTLDWKKKVQTAKQKGAVLVLIIDSKFADNLKNNKKLISTYGWKPMATEEGDKSGALVNSMFISADVAKAIMGPKADKAETAMNNLKEGKQFKPVKIKTKMTLRMEKESKRLEGANVLAVIEGSDPKYKKEYVLVTAHYDHLGMADSTVIYYGADDNASGTAGVIEIARAFEEARKQGKGPLRTVVCMLVSGEEKGLLGSKYYVEFPIFPLEKTIVDINIDMIGRVDDKHAQNPNYVYVIGADRLSQELHNMNEIVNAETVKLELDYRYNAKDDPNHYYERSDHYNFAEKNIPAIFFFNGTHADYHRPTDTPDKINFDVQAKRAQLAFYLAWDMANRPTKLAMNVDIRK